MWKRIGIALIITLGVSLAWGRVTDLTRPFGFEIVVYVAVYVALTVLGSRGDVTTPQPDLPLSGPIGQRGRAAFVLRFTLSSQLSLLNPWQLGQQLRQLAGLLAVRARYRDKLPSTENTRSQARYTLPFCGEWYIINGGVTQETSHSWDSVAQRYAYDFVVVDDNLARHRGDGTQLDDYHCYGLPVIAVADGEVVAVSDGVRNAPKVGYGWADFGCRDIRGNHVTIRHGEREYSFYAHLIPRSITARVGDTVERGQEIGRCGHSGHSTEPHLHFHFQDHPDFFSAMGLPLPFESVVLDDEPAASEPVHLTRWTHVRNRECPGSHNGSSAGHGEVDVVATRD